MSGDNIERWSPRVQRVQKCKHPLDCGPAGSPRRVGLWEVPVSGSGSTQWHTHLTPARPQHLPDTLPLWHSLQLSMDPPTDTTTWKWKYPENRNIHHDPQVLLAMAAVVASKVSRVRKSIWTKVIGRYKSLSNHLFPRKIVFRIRKVGIQWMKYYLSIHVLYKNYTCIL